MSVKGRTFPFRLVYQYPGMKPGTKPYHRRDEAEWFAFDLQQRGARAEVVLVDGKTRTVISEHLSLDDPAGLSRSGYATRRTVDGRTTLITLGAERLYTEEQARYRARQEQRNGHAAEVLRNGRLIARYPELDSDVVNHPRIAVPTYDEKTFLHLPHHSHPVDTDDDVRAVFGLVDRKLKDYIDAEAARKARQTQGTGPTPVGKAAGAYRHTFADCPGYRQAAPTAEWCARCGIRKEEHRETASAAAEGPLSRQLRAPAEVESPAPAAEPSTYEDPAVVAAIRSTLGQPPSGDVEDGTPDDSCTTGPEHRYDLVHEDDDVRQYRCTAPGCGAETYEDKADDEARERELDAERLATLEAEGPLSRQLRTLADVGRTYRDLNATLERGADDAEDALGGELGRVIAGTFRFVADQGSAMGETGRMLARVAELVTERALAHRQFSRGGPDRRDIDKAALNAYSDRFEPSRHEVRDHQAAMHDAIDAVFDAVAQGQRRVLLKKADHPLAAVGHHGNCDEGLPWMSTDGGYLADSDVEGWLEMMPTGRVFKPGTDGARDA